MVELNETLRVRAMALADPVPIAVADPSQSCRTGSQLGDDDDAPTQFLVTSEKDRKVQFRVDIEAVRENEYSKACACGMASSSWVGLPCSALSLARPLFCRRLGDTSEMCTIESSVTSPRAFSHVCSTRLLLVYSCAGGVQALQALRH